MDILIAMNRRYFFNTRVFLHSLLKTNRGMRIHLMHSDLTERMLSRLEDDVGDADNGSSLDVIYIDSGRVGGVMVSEKVTQETYYRLLMMDYIPQEVERLLYLDTDIIVKGDISEFYGMSIDTEFAAVCEDPCYIKSNPIRESVFSKLSFSDSDHYFNAGVILFNMRRIREKFSTDDFLDFAINRQDIITYHDQDVLNYLFKNHVRWVPECYNCRICMYPDETRDRVFEEAKIVHYGPKPWQPEYGRVFASEIFWENAKELGYYRKWLTYLVRRDMVRARNKAVRMIKGRKG